MPFGRRWRRGCGAPLLGFNVNYARYLDKPPLGYWLIGLSYLVFGVSEFAARLPIAMAAMGGVSVTWTIGRDLFGDRAGFLAEEVAGLVFYAG
jgi:dolichyl-phosphate-mannose-protein mannosyltransferase